MEKHYLYDNMNERRMILFAIYLDYTKEGKERNSNEHNAFWCKTARKK